MRSFTAPLLIGVLAVLSAQAFHIIQSDHNWQDLTAIGVLLAIGGIALAWSIVAIVKRERETRNRMASRISKLEAELLRGSRSPSATDADGNSRPVKTQLAEIEASLARISANQTLLFDAAKRSKTYHR